MANITNYNYLASLGSRKGYGYGPVTQYQKTGAWPGTTTTPSYAGLARQMTAQQASARQANIQRYTQAMKIYEDVIARAQRGGAFEKAGLAEIERARTRGVGQEMQQMISSGTYGTTTAAGVPRAWEAEVGAPARLRLEDIMEQRLTQAQLGKAGFIERREDVYPDYTALLSLLMR